MKNLFNLIPRWNRIYAVPIDGKDRLIVDACYNAVAKLSNEGHRVYQLRFNEVKGLHITEINCSRDTFYHFLHEYTIRTKKYIWKIDHVK